MANARIVVIGGGPAGVAAALEASMAGGEVTLVHAEPIGGRATWHSLVPSKVYLSAADALDDADRQGALGLEGAAPTPSLAALRARIATEASAWAERQSRQLARAGVRLIAGSARLTGPEGCVVARDSAAGGGEEELAFDRAIVASGSVPVFPPEIRPDGRRIIAPRLVGKLAEWPAHLIVIGGGVTGAEFAYFFARMGRRVSWVTDRPAMLPRMDADLADALTRSMAARGVVILTSAPVVAARADEAGVRVSLEDGRALEGSHAFIAIGRKPDLADLGLAACGIEAGDGPVVLDGFCRSECASVYLIGDAAGAPYVANRALAQARVAARHAAGAGTRPFRPDVVIEATYTAPQLACVGLGEAAAAAEEIDVTVCRMAYADALKPRLIGGREGFVKLIVAADDGRVLGAGAFGHHAAEILTPVALAIAEGLVLDDLADLFPAYPTLSELPFSAARGYTC